MNVLIPKLTLLTGAVVVAGVIGLAGARQSAAPGAGQDEAARVPVDADDIGGMVIGPRGPEAGVWVIAETNDLSTKFRKIVVTDDRGRYLLPDLPKANYEVWVRGYGLIDSAHVRAVPGATLALTAVVAPNAQAAAQYYPANYWFSLMQIPPKDAFPVTVQNATGHPVTGNAAGGGTQVIQNQTEWVSLVKCTGCHQMGTKATRELSKNLGTFDSSIKAWDRALRSGQTGANTGRVNTTMISTVDRFGHERGLAMFADWSDRIAAGEVPQAPPRPQGVERTLVVTLWDFSTRVAFVHDARSTDKRHPTVNAYGPIYGTEWSQDALVTVDPAHHTKGLMKVPLADEQDRKSLPTWTPQSMEEPSPVWGDELIWDDRLNPHSVMMDGKARPWFIAVTHTPEKQPAYCKEGSNNPFAKNAPLPTNGRGVGYYDPKTAKITMFSLCITGSHMVFAEDPDDTLFFSFKRERGGVGGIGWVKTRLLLETGDAEKAQGWCPPILDYNGDGKLGAYTRPPEPAEPTLDRLEPTGGYGVATNPVDGSAWYADTTIPGRLVRMQLGTHPPATCMTEFYEPPFNNPKAPGVLGANPRGVDIDRNGLVWTALSDTNQLASFDRRKCKVLRGPTATGQHCPEGWTLYPTPGPKFKGVTDQLGADFLYYNWVDQFDVFGLGKNTPFATGTWSDALMALDPATKKWTVLRVPYPLGFYTREMDGRVDDPKAGWKGRGLWAASETRVTWLGEGGKGATSYVAHFQLRPDPLAR